MVLPNLEVYYKTTLLATFLKRYTALYNTPWKDIMDAAYYPSTFGHIIWDHPRDRKPRHPPSPLNAVSLEEWDEHKRLHIPKYSSLHSFLNQKWFPPGWSPASFSSWREGGLICFWEIIDQGKLMLKELLEAKIKDKIPWFEYYQVSHLYNRLKALELLEMTKTPLEHLMTSTSLPSKGLISAIYDSLISFTPKGQFAWQKELGKPIEDLQWDTL